MNFTMPGRKTLRTLALALTLAGASAPALAQEPDAPPVEGEGSGRPLDGYLATAALVGLALFIAGKSARR